MLKTSFCLALELMIMILVYISLFPKSAEKKTVVYIVAFIMSIAVVVINDYILARVSYSIISGLIILDLVFTKYTSRK